MVCMMAMQGIGRPGVNMGNMQQGTPLDTHFYFPGYSEGGLSGDVRGNGMIVSMYQRMPQLPTINTVMQRVPKQRLPEAIMEGKAEGYMCDPSSIESQFAKVSYPMEGCCAHTHVLPLRRRLHRHHERHQPLGERLPQREPGVRGQPEHLDGGRDQVRRHHPARLHQLRALGHKRVVQLRRLHPAQLHAAQPPRVHHAAQVHRALGREQVGLSDLLRALPAPGAGHDVLGGRHRARLGQAPVRRHRPLRQDLVEALSEARLLRARGTQGAPCATRCR